MRRDYPIWWQRWNGRKPFWPWLLTPIMGAYIVLSALRQYVVKPTKVPVPVVCVGNIAIGGVGKTPFLVLLAQILQEKGLQVHVLGHGYGAKQKTPHRVDLTVDNASRVGDEALLIAQYAPVWVGGNRLARAKVAIAAGAELLLMDDGWQDPSLYKDTIIAIVHGQYPWGNGYRLPLGPLRVTPYWLALASVIAVHDKLDQVVPEELRVYQPIEMHRQSIWRDQLPESENILLFCGIGRAQQFFDLAENLCLDAGKSVCDRRAFSDHYVYTEDDLQALVARNPDGALVTTEKDWIRLPKSWQDRVSVISLRLDGAEGDDFQRLVDNIIQLTA